MKKLLTIVLIALATSIFAQTNPITAINITLPANPDANTANWGTGTSLLLITASAPSATGRVSPDVAESKLLVIIKQNGNKVCGDYTSNTAPSSDFNTATKVWSGSNAASFLGKGCVLKPGDYTLSVQFFGNSNGKTVALSDEKIKPFTIRGNDQQAYQVPQGVAPAKGAVLNQSDLLKPITFRWTPVIPKPQEPVTYRISVWQLMQGQTGPQAIKANQPILTKDVDNMTQAAITNLVTGQTKPPYLNSFIWTVQALNKAGKGYGANNGVSEPLAFTATSCDVNLALKLVSVDCLPATNGNNNYKVCVSSTYSSAFYNLTYANAGSGFKAYGPANVPYSISGLSPALQVQNSGSSATTVNYCFQVSVPTSQQSIQIGLQGDDKDPGPITCQPGFSLALRLPVCKPTCDCGTWGPLTIPQAAGRPLSYKCGSSIPWSCSQPFNFTSTYQCSSTDKTCQAITSWAVTQGSTVIKSGNGTTSIAGGFTPTANGSYTVTLNSLCGGVKCAPCTYNVVVTNCVTCNCGTWGPLSIQQVGGRAQSYKCGSEIAWNCGQPLNFTSTYQCNSTDKTCRAITLWTVTQGSAVIKSGNGTSSIAGGFTPTANGTYTITLNSSCGGVKCPPCTYTVVVKNCVVCDCGKWASDQGTATINTVSGHQNKTFKCGDVWNNVDAATVGNVDIAFANYNCSTPNCQATYTWTISGPATHSGTTNTIYGANFSVPGSYVVSIVSYCGGKKCGSCKLTINVVKPPVCNCGTWNPLKIVTGNGKAFLTYKCGSTIPASCNQPLNFTSSYQCSPTDKSCTAVTSWSVTQGRVVVKSGNSASAIVGSFTPTANGTYTITLNAVCGGKQCPPCIYTVEVKNCVTCSCGTWGSFIVPHTTGASVEYKCGSTIKWTAGQPFNFTDSYHCASTGGACQATTSWEITQGRVSVKKGTGTASLTGAFTPASSGNYTLTINATCNGKPCPPCVIYLQVAPDPCPTLCNGGFETILNGAAPTATNWSSITDMANISCWKTTESDHKMEIWKGGDSGVPAYAGSYFAEINATTSAAIYQSFTTVTPKIIVVSFAHRGRYNGVDSMRVSLIHGTVSVDLGVYTANNKAWHPHTLTPISLAGATTYTLKFASISSNNGKGPLGGGNFLDAVSISCVDVLPNTQTSSDKKKR